MGEPSARMLIITRFGPVVDGSFDEILATLEDAIADLRKPDDAPEKKGNASIESKTIEAGAAERPGAADADPVRRLAAEAAEADVRNLRRGEYVLIWQGEKNDIIEGSVRGLTANGRPAAGLIRAHIDSRTDGGKKLHVTYLTASPIVDSHGDRTGSGKLRRENRCCRRHQQAQIARCRGVAAKAVTGSSG
jgi:hypothetical protein